MKKKLFITWVTYYSRYNEKMKLLKIPRKEGYYFDFDDRILIYNLLQEKLKLLSIENYTLNVLSDHVHLVIEYEEEDLSVLVKTLKGYVSFKYSRIKKFGKKGEGRKNKIWAKGYSKTYLNTNDHYQRAINYTKNNHSKHEIEDITQINTNLQFINN